MSNMSWGLVDGYFQLHTTHGESPFTIKEASRALEKSSRATRLELHRLNKNLAISRIDRGRYTTVDPDKWAGLRVSLKRFPGLKPFFEKILPMLPHIDSILLYGSRVRGDSSEESDYDILMVTDGTRLFTEEEGADMKRRGFEVTDGHITELRENIKNNPVFLVPILKESWPIFNKKVKRSLLRSFRNENLLNDLQDISKDLIKLKYVDDPEGDVKRSMLYLHFARSRHLFLIDSLIMEKEYTKGAWLNQMRGIWGLSTQEISNLLKLYKDIEHNEKPRMEYFDKTRRDKISKGNMDYYDSIVRKMETI